MKRCRTLKNDFFAGYGNVSAGTIIELPDDYAEFARQDGRVQPVIKYGTHFAKGEIVRFYYNGKYRIGRVNRMVHRDCVTMEMLTEGDVPTGGFKSFKISKMVKILGRSR